MHVLIGVIVNGEDKDDALANAEFWANDRVPEKFDYYTMADHPAFKERWGDDLPAVMEIDDPIAKQFIEDQISATKIEVEKCLHKAYEIFNGNSEDYDSMFSYLRRIFSPISAFLFYYDDPIISWKQIEELKDICNKYGEKLYVVPLDVHI